MTAMIINTLKTTSKPGLWKRKVEWLFNLPIEQFNTVPWTRREVDSVGHMYSFLNQLDEIIPFILGLLYVA